MLAFTEKGLYQSNVSLDKSLNETSPGSQLCGMLDLCQQENDRLSNKTDRPDYATYRLHLWEAMQEFPDRCEPKSKLIVPLFMDFLV